MQVKREAAKEQGGKEKIRVQPKSEGIRKNITILVVEDDDGCRNSIVRILAKEFKVKTARNGQEGLEKYKEGEIDVVITDLRMPIMDGFTLLMELQDLDPESKVIVVSSLITAENSEMLSDAGAKNIMKKPYDLEELHRAIVSLAGS